MPNLAQLSDYDPMGNYTGGIVPVDQPIVAPSSTSSTVDKVINNLLRDDDKRYQLWPEKVATEAGTAAHDVMNEGTLPPGLRREDFTDIPPPQMPTKDSTALGKMLGITPVAASPADPLIEKAQAISAAAGTGGLGGVTDATLGATPFLRPALKYKDKLYKGKPGQEHQDVIPAHLYPEFQDMAMKGEDISHYNFGFVNDKGHFLNREDALKYGIDTGLIDPHAGKYGALTSTLMADSSKPGTAIEAMAKAEPFYSALEHNVKNIKQEKMTGDAWLGTLSNKPGVKPEELDWTGLKSFLEENNGKPVTKGQIESHLEANKVELKEVNKGVTVPLQNRIDAYIKQGYDYEGASERAYADHDATNFSNTKYHSYQLPGGENYREMLLTTPTEMNKYNSFIKELRAKYGEGGLANKPLTEVERIKLDKLQETAGDNGQSAYKSSHWDEPNILAHVRMNDRTIDGKKALHLEEIQSDWHQQGRDKGYKLPVEEAKKLEDRRLELENLGGKLRNEGKEIPEEVKTEWAGIMNKLQPENTVRVPDAPFKKTWHELALKRMIREAAEKGYSRLSWTPGEAQAARYDLSNSVDNVKWSPEGQRLEAFKDGRSIMSHSNVSADKLPDYIGKEAANKLINDPSLITDLGKAKLHHLVGQDLKVGGEGMKGFYDQIIPKSIEKIGKEHGVKVKQGALPNDLVRKTVDDRYAVVGDKRTFDTKAEAEAAAKKDVVHYIDIPQSLRDAAMHKGFPLFSSTHIFTPVAGNPFDDK